MAAPSVSHRTAAATGRSSSHVLVAPPIVLAVSSNSRPESALIVHVMPAVPLLSRWIDMPALELPGDAYMPRVQGLSAGASERLVVSPGREEHAIFHMPTGQSGHPLSPHYADGRRWNLWRVCV